MELNELIKDLALRQKKGLHFILAYVVIWSGVLAVYLTNLSMVHIMIFIQIVLSACLHFEVKRMS